MIEDEIQGENEDQLMDLMGIYGEENLIKYLSESILNKERVLRRYYKNLNE
ncbi:MAG: hypothetical protein ACJA2M_000274 [Polaribacter sp.]|jgi:hypothetical protein